MWGIRALLIILLLLFILGCDQRNSKQTLTLYGNVNHSYINDATIITIECQFISNNNINQRIYFKCNNGSIRKIGNVDWEQQNEIINVNTDQFGKCSIQYSNPTQAGYSTIKA